MTDTAMQTNAGSNGTTDAEGYERGDSLWARAYRKLMSQRMVVVCMGIIVFYCLITLLGYLGLLPDFQERVGQPHEAPSLEFARILGTDLFGRSVFYKVLAGTKTAMTLALTVTAIAVPIGVILGALSGYYGGRVDSVIVWFYSVIVSVPYILLVIAVSYALGKGLLAVCVAVGLVNWVSLCRMIRGEVMKHKNSEYVLAARLIGASNGLIIFKHILPNVIHLAIITGSIMSLSAIKIEVILTYIGVGVQSGASWGTMIASAPGELVNGIWWPLAAVAAAMFFVSYSLNVVGDALRDSLDPKLL